MSLGDSKYMTAAYHLNKETGLKSGEINIIKVDTETGTLTLEKQHSEMDYGVLSLELLGSNQVSIGCSDGSVRIGDIEKDNFEKVYEV